MAFLELPSPKAGQLPPAMAVFEDDEESKVTSQLLRQPSTLNKLPKTEVQTQVLVSDAGKYDALLQPGRSKELCTILPIVFAKDARISWSSDRASIGKSCTSFPAEGQYGKEVFSSSEVAKFISSCASGTDCLWTPGPEGNILNLLPPSGGRMIFLGDTHGQLEDVLWVFFKYGIPSENNVYVFNGDIVDRGGHALEILLLLLSFKRDVASCVHIIRGNHEDANCAVQFGFKTELEHKFQSSYGPVMQACFEQLFPMLPLAGLVHVPDGHKPFFLVHGGVPVDLPNQTKPISLDQVASLNRHKVTLFDREDPDTNLMFNLCWADPSANPRPAVRSAFAGRGNPFYESDSIAFCEQNHLQMIVRSHELKPQGVTPMHSGRCLTLFSASNYGGGSNNTGGALILSTQPKFRFDAEEFWAPDWAYLAKELPDKLLKLSCDERKAEASKFEKNFLAVLPASPSSPTGAPAAAQKAQKAILEKSVATLKPWFGECIVLFKQAMFEAFRKLDSTKTGQVTRDQWIQVMHQEIGNKNPQVISHELLLELAKSWNISDSLAYTRFLHRFQIKCNFQSINQDIGNLLHQVNTQAMTLSAVELEQFLDPDSDATVSEKEFIEIFPKFGQNVAESEAKVIYQWICDKQRRRPLSLDDTILFLASVRWDPVPVTDLTKSAEVIGREILSSGNTYASVFRLFDTDKNGLLSFEEIASGLGKYSPHGQSLTKEKLQALIQHIDGSAVRDNKITIFEFCRALAPGDLVASVHQILIKELFRRVWICRPALLAMIHELDHTGTGVVSKDQFRACLNHLNQQLEAQQLTLIPDTELEAICDIAAPKDAKTVQYRGFLEGLVIADMG